MILKSVYLMKLNLYIGGWILCLRKIQSRVLWVVL